MSGFYTRNLIFQEGNYFTSLLTDLAYNLFLNDYYIENSKTLFNFQHISIKTYHLRSIFKNFYFYKWFYKKTSFCFLNKYLLESKFSLYKKSNFNTKYVRLKLDLIFFIHYLFDDAFFFVYKRKKTNLILSLKLKKSFYKANQMKLRFELYPFHQKSYFLLGYSAIFFYLKKDKTIAYKILYLNNQILHNENISELVKSNRYFKNKKIQREEAILREKEKKKRLRAEKKRITKQNKLFTKLKQKNDN